MTKWEMALAGLLSAFAFFLLFNLPPVERWRHRVKDDGREKTPESSGQVRCSGNEEA